MLDVFDHDLESVLGKLMQNPLRFNSFVRIFFSEVVIEVTCPDCGWRKAKKKDEQPLSDPRLTKFALDPKFETYIEQAGIQLPETPKQSARYS